MSRDIPQIYYAIVVSYSVDVVYHPVWPFARMKQPQNPVYVIAFALKSYYHVSIRV